ETSNSFLLVIAITLFFLAYALYFHALVLFKESRISVKWIYYLVAISFIENFYFIIIDFDINTRVVQNSLLLVVFSFANSALLFSCKKPIIYSISHRLTGSIFAFIACVGLIRTIYYGFFHTEFDDSFLHIDLMQSVAFLTSTVLIVGTSFGFSLMCNDKHFAEKDDIQAALQEALERLQKITSQLPEMVYQLKLSADGQFSISYCSDSSCSIFGLTPAQIYQDVNLLFHEIFEEDYEHFMDSIYESAKNLTPWFCNFRILFSYDEERWLEGHAMPQRSQDGSVLWHGLITDITERKAKEQQLRVLSVAVEQSPASVMITDLNANIVYVNPKFAEITGYSVEEVLGKKPSILRSNFTPPSMYQEVWNTLQNGGVWHGEIINKRKNGELYWDETHIAPVRNTLGEITHYAGVKLDVSERKRIEEQLRDSESFTSSVLDALTAHIAVINANGIIIAVNKAWQQFGKENGLLYESAIGSNYFNACHTIDIDSAESNDIQKNMMAVLTGKLDSFELEYPCHSPTEQRWFNM
ncbi:hypothetical protein BAC3_01789, partial [uncultured bacterium]